MGRRETVRVARAATTVVVHARAGGLLVARVELHRDHAVARLNGVLEGPSLFFWVDTSVGSKVNMGVPGARQWHVDGIIRCAGGDGRLGIPSGIRVGRKSERVSHGGRIAHGVVARRRRSVRGVHRGGSGCVGGLGIGGGRAGMGHPAHGHEILGNRK